MYTLGIIMSEDPSDLKIIEKIDSNDFQSKVIEKMEQTDEVDGILINVDDNENSQVFKGLEWLTNLRKVNMSVPVWLYSSRPMSQVEQKLCLHLGANGVFSSGIDDDSMFIILKNTLNCINASDTAEQSQSNSTIVLNPDSHSLLLDGQIEIYFTRLEFMLISYLYDHADKVMTYQDISNHLWHDGHTKQKYRVAHIIFLIRKKLGEEGKDLIRTVRSIGYQLNKQGA